MGQIEVPADRYWGAQTQRSLSHFSIGEDRLRPGVGLAQAKLNTRAPLSQRSLRLDSSESG